jgi:hypothetical protein
MPGTRSPLAAAKKVSVGAVLPMNFFFSDQSAAIVGTRPLSKTEFRR